MKRLLFALFIAALVTPSLAVADEDEDHFIAYAAEHYPICVIPSRPSSSVTDYRDDAATLSICIEEMLYAGEPSPVYQWARKDLSLVCQILREGYNAKPIACDRWYAKAP